MLKKRHIERSSWDDHHINISQTTYFGLDHGAPCGHTDLLVITCSIKAFENCRITGAEIINIFVEKVHHLAEHFLILIKFHDISTNDSSMAKGAVRRINSDSELRIVQTEVLLQAW